MIDDFNEELRQAEIEYLEILNDILSRRDEWIGSVWPKYKLGNYIIDDSGWGCPDSPFDYCAYDDIEDPVHDYCIFCGEPYERK